MDRINNIYLRQLFLKSKVGPTLILLAILPTFYLNKTQARQFDSISDLAIKCIKERNLQSCRIALNRAENYQIHAASQARYSCQTRLLGLQSHLTMVILGSLNKKASAIAMIEEVRKACKYL